MHVYEDLLVFDLNSKHAAYLKYALYKYCKMHWISLPTIFTLQFQTTYIPQAYCMSNRNWSEEKCQTVSDEITKQKMCIDTVSVWVVC